MVALLPAGDHARDLVNYRGGIPPCHHHRKQLVWAARTPLRGDLQRIMAELHLQASHLLAWVINRREGPELGPCAPRGVPPRSQQHAPRGGLRRAHQRIV